MNKKHRLRGQCLVQSGKFILLGIGVRRVFNSKSKGQGRKKAESFLDNLEKGLNAVFEI